MSLQEIEQIRSQVEDWSAQVCPDATLDDLDPEAIRKARRQYEQKNPSKVNEVGKWDDATFLNKAKVTRQGKITRAAIVLLGKEESESFLSPSVARITWILRGENEIQRDYRHFGPPFILNAEKVFTKIRNLTYRYLPNETLFPTEVSQYDPWVIREALHNCIAHQDYDLAKPTRVSVHIQGRILNENYTRLLIKNRDIDLPTVMFLDKVQKQVRLSKNEHKFLKSKKLIEGRYPNLFVSSRIAAATEEKAKYIRNRGFDRKYYRDMVVEYIKKNGSATRKEIDELVLTKLPEILTEKQKKNIINNMLYEMSRKLGLIVNTASRKYPIWVLPPEQTHSVSEKHESY